MSVRRPGTSKLGWCLTGHHASCPASTVGGLVCACSCHEASLPIHRTEAGWPRCATCDGGGCPDCTDPA